MSATTVGSLREAAEVVAAMRAEIRRAVIGQDAVVEQVLAALMAGGHVLLEGVPGVGKTLLVLALARTFSGSFARVQFTPDLMPSDVTGHAVLDAAGQMRIRRGPAFTHLLLADEINRAPAKTQAALLEVMQEGQITIEGQAFPLPPPFMALATQNPIEHDGTYPLPEAQLDRFLLKVFVGYPSHADEVRILRSVTAERVGDRLLVDGVGTVTSPEGVEGMRQQVARVLVDDRVLDYAVQVARRTRDWRGLATGAGPRGGLALVRVARALALLDGRDHVLPDDVKAAAAPTLRHRVRLTPDLEMEGVTVDEVLRELLAAVEAPRR